MTRPKAEKLTPLELEIMHVLWEEGSANVQSVQQKLKRPLAYTTVQTMLNILHRKGKVKRTLKDRAYFYKPSVTREKVISKQVRSQPTSYMVGCLFYGRRSLFISNAPTGG